jgi:xanthine/uracil permease
MVSVISGVVPVILLTTFSENSGVVYVSDE